ncbi:MAG: MraY family glycosyltransferase [Verrucomicrobiales bacterium]|nr:MraY family glycosyltransferase [Verrucomicrobiales bacterium]
MRFPGQIYLAVFFSAALTSFLTLPLWRRACQRIGLVDEPGGRKLHGAPVPLAGGLAVLTGLIVPLAAGAAVLLAGWPNLPARDLLVYGLGKRAVQLAVIALGALAITALGIFDDRHELRPLPKFLGQLLVALAVAAAGVRVTLFVPNPLFSYAITVLWLLTVINAFNFTDNMNGLCTGLGAIAAGCFAALAALAGHYLVASMAFLICGALLGFLPWNFPRARAFLGDAGSHLVGYLLGVLAILPHFYSPETPTRWGALAVLTPLLVLAVPLGDLVRVVLWRWRRGQPVYVGDTNHVSHLLVQAGWSPTRAVLCLWLLAAMLGGLTLLQRLP